MNTGLLIATVVRLGVIIEHLYAAEAECVALMEPGGMRDRISAPILDAIAQARAVQRQAVAEYGERMLRGGE